MKIKMNFKKATLIAITMLISTTAFAQHRHYGHVHPYTYRPAVVTIVNRPAVTTHISNRLSKKDRLDMALAYLKNNKSLSISKYSKMTGLTKATAEAELDAFAFSNSSPIKIIMNGKKKLYVLA
ncbi:MAG TPA: hypothetical protein DDZ04_03870 [Parabacteroides sp.]|nr:hypothetical protein [Parabacteroides sp.]